MRIIITIIVVFFLLNSKIYAKENTKIKKINIDDSDKKTILNIKKKHKLDIKEIIRIYRNNIDISNIKVSTQKEKLNIKVTRLKKIRNIYIFGEHNKSFLTQLQKYKIKNNNYITLLNLELLKNKFKKNIYDKGIASNINIKIKNIENNKIDLYINITSTKTPLKIEKIIIAGNKRMSKEDIFKIISFYNFKTKIWANIKNFYQKKEFTEELEKIKNFYINNGFIDFQFRNIKIIVKEKNKIYFLIDIHEGWQHYINEIILKHEKINNDKDSKENDDDQTKLSDKIKKINIQKNQTYQIEKVIDNKFQNIPNIKKKYKINKNQPYEKKKKINNKKKIEKNNIPLDKKHKKPFEKLNDKKNNYKGNELYFTPYKFFEKKQPYKEDKLDFDKLYKNFEKKQPYKEDKLDFDKLYKNFEKKESYKEDELNFELYKNLKKKQSYKSKIERIINENSKIIDDEKDKLISKISFNKSLEIINNEKNKLISEIKFNKNLKIININFEIGFNKNSEIINSKKNKLIFEKIFNKLFKIINNEKNKLISEINFDKTNEKINNEKDELILKKEINTTFTENEKNPDKNLKIKKKFAKNSIFTMSRANKIKKLVLSSLHSKGFLEIDTEMDIQNAGSGLTNIIFKIEKCEQFNIDNVTIVNNYKTPDHVLRKHFGTNELTRPSIKTFIQQKKKISEALNYASKLEYEILPSISNKHEKNLIFNITEKNENKFVLGLSLFKGFIGINTHADFGHFLGSEYDVIFKLRRTKKSTEYNINCFGPKYLGTGYDINYNIFYKKDRIDETVKNFFSSKSKGILITFSKKISHHVKFDMILGATKTSLKLPNEYNYFIVDEFINRNGCNFRDYSISVAFTYNTMKKNKNLPTDISEGINSNLLLYLTVPPSDLRYFIFTYEFYMFKKIMKKCFIGLYVNLMWGDKYYEDAPDFPFFKFFQLTGKKKVRGYKDKTLGPRDYRNIPIGGNILTLFKASLYLPTPNFKGSENFRPYLFIDAGQLYHTSEYFFEEPLNLEDDQTYNNFLRFSAGLTIHWKTPLGIPMEFVYAHAINPEFDDQTEKFSIHIYSTGKRPTK